MIAFMTMVALVIAACYICKIVQSQTETKEPDTEFLALNSRYLNTLKVPSDGCSRSKKTQDEPVPEIRIKYVNSNGQMSTRDLSNLRYSNSSVFHAYCHVRKEERTFRADRVIEAWSLPDETKLSEIEVKWGTNGRTRSFYFSSN